MEKEFKGKPNYPGTVKGYLVKSLQNISRYQNPIFYTTDFTIDHTLLIDKIRGLVVKRGSWSTHAAIIAREFRVPSVIGVNLDDIPEGTEIELVSPSKWFNGDRINSAKVIVHRQGNP